MRTAWEYKIVELSFIGGDVDYRNSLVVNHLGEEGWQLVSAAPQDKYHVLYFKRPKV